MASSSSSSSSAAVPAATKTRNRGVPVTCRTLSLPVRDLNDMSSLAVSMPTHAFRVLYDNRERKAQRSYSAAPAPSRAVNPCFRTPLPGDFRAALSPTSDLRVSTTTPIHTRSGEWRSTATVSPGRSPRVLHLVTQQNFRWSDTQLSPIQSSKDFPSDMSMPHQTRNEKFHRQFPDIKDEVIKSYHCALLDDIRLFQGVLYVTANWFCFYSKLIVTKKSIQIPVRSVTNIVKLNTALIIPNAVGIYTENEKYVFGSLLARKNTFHFLTKIWQEASPNTLSVNTIITGYNVDVTTNNNKLRHSRNPSDTTNNSRTSGSSETSYSAADPASSPGQMDSLMADVDDEEEDDVPSSSVFAMDSFEGRRSISSVALLPDSVVPSGLRKRQSNSNPPVDGGDEVGKSNKDGNVVQSDASATWTIRNLSYKLQTTSGFLSIMTAIIVLLLVCAVFMSFKLVRLRAHQEAISTVYARDVKVVATLSGEETYRLRHERHCAIINKLHAVTQEHVKMLDKVKQSLEELSQAADINRLNSLKDDLFDAENQT